jgi:anaerobic dimethyl sulfoxide reductase subunit A
MTEKDFLIKALTDTALTRRSFLKWSAALGGTAALAGGLNYGLKAVGTVAAETNGKWLCAPCWGNCGGRYPNYALVKDGVVIRQKTDDTHPDSPEYPQQRGCARGRSQRHQVFGADRLKYPMKRKNWEPGGGKRELRGQDEWVRISWDEALDLVAGEIKRIKEAYGNTAIMKGGYSNSFTKGFGEVTKMLWQYGGLVEPWGITSAGSWQNSALFSGSGGTDLNDRFDFVDSQLIVMWGRNDSWSSAGNPSYYLLQAKKAGAKFIFIDPFYNPTAQALADEWIPVRPATDHALALGIAYTLITEDDPIDNPLIDWDFLNRCTVGFDADHMPEGADPKENFQDYVLGTYDGLPKTPEWAAQICGTPPATIRKLAREIGSTKKVAMLTSASTARVHNSDSWPHAFMTLGWMMGHAGQPGRMTGRSGVDGGPGLIGKGGTGLPSVSNPLGKAGSNYPKDGDGVVKVNYAESWTAVLTGKHTQGKGDVRDIDIRMIYHDNAAQLNQRCGMTKGIEAHRKVEFVVAHHFSLHTQAKYADIVLPVTTQWERDGMLDGGREYLIYMNKIVEPMFEAKHDRWVAEELAKRLGVDATTIWPISEKQMLFNEVAGAEVITPDGSGFEPLVTITADDIAEWGVEGEPQQGRIGLKEFQEQGIYQVKVAPGDQFSYIALKEFREDPEGHPQDTASGKLEIHSQAYADYIDKIGFTKISPIPTYDPAIEGYQDTFSDWEKKAKGDYPLQLYTIHYPRRSHSAYDNIPSLREAFPQEFIMNPLDAEARGIKHGDAVLITSRHGKVLRPVYVTERMMPGVTTLGEGAWVQIDEETGIDMAGATNTLSGQIPTGQGYQGWNSCNVQVEKWTGKALDPDKNWPQRVPLGKEA